LEKKHFQQKWVPVLRPEMRLSKDAAVRK